MDSRWGLVAVSVVVVVWASWRVGRQPTVAVTVLLVAGLALAVLSAPVAIATALFLRRPHRRLERLPGWVTSALILGAVGLLGTEAANTGLGGYVTVAVALLGLLTFAVILPLTLGSLAAQHVGDGPPGVVVAWSACLLAGGLVFFAPGADGIDFGRYNALFLAEPLRSLVVATIATLVLFGPAVVVLVSAALRNHRLRG